MKLANKMPVRDLIDILIDNHYTFNKKNRKNKRFFSFARHFWPVKWVKTTHLRLILIPFVTPCPNGKKAPPEKQSAPEHCRRTLPSCKIPLVKPVGFITSDSLSGTGLKKRLIHG
jgi:hypothetical protein